MPAFTQLLYLTALAVTCAGAASVQVVSPALKGQWDSPNILNLTASTTDSSTIADTASVVEQKGGATSDAPPDQPPADTVVTAVDGQLTDAGSSNLTSRATSASDTRSLVKRTRADYTQVFAGTGTGPNDRDGSIEGTAYLTYTVVSNSTYNIDACLDFCSRVDGCVFANLYYEFNNELLDFVFSEKSNLKCAVYGDVHTAAEKTNKGGQQSIAPPAGLTYIQQSSGFAANSLVEPPVPSGYEIAFGPLDGANNAPGYMGFAFIDRYDVLACAELCNTRGPDPNGGACQYFNIWRALVNGVPTTYTCSMYYIPADSSTAVNFGQGDLKVTFSRGYVRKSAVFDGGFEGYTCDGLDFCFAASSSSWTGTSPAGGTLDASVFHWAPYAHSGSSVGLLGSANGDDALSGTLTPNSFRTTAGKTYRITFFHASAFSGPTLEAEAFVDILWNGAVLSTIRPGYSQWTYYEFTATAIGNDVLAFHGGKAPAWSFIDDVYVFEV